MSLTLPIKNKFLIDFWGPRKTHGFAGWLMSVRSRRRASLRSSLADIKGIKIDAHVADFYGDFIV